MTRTHSTTRPRYRCCDSCGRNDWKVAIRMDEPRRTATSGGTTLVYGLCPSCFASDVARGYLQVWAERGYRVVADLRGAAARNRTPVPAELLPPPPRATRPDEHGLAVWVACGHRAELNINECCYTCGGRV